MGAAAPTGLLARLRAGTRDEHAAVERALGLPDSVRDRHDLARALRTLLRAWEPLEGHLLATRGWASLDLPPDPGLASHLLRRDLDTLGRPTGDGTVAFTTPPSLSSGVGVRYVLLGSAIGGRVLAPLLEQRLALPPGQGPRSSAGPASRPPRTGGRSAGRWPPTSRPWTPTPRRTPPGSRSRRSAASLGGSPRPFVASWETDA